MSNERLIYLPLGGAGEIGMNAYVYGHGAPGRERLILVDLGVTFPDMDSTPGVDLIMPDMGWLKANADRLEAIFITHAHEDHVGAVLGWEGLLGSFLGSRRLVQLVPEAMDSPHPFYLRIHGRASANARLFADWLVAQETPE